MIRNINKIHLTFEQIFGHSTGTLPVSSISPWYEYKDNIKTDNLLGNRYEVTSPVLGMNLHIKVRGNKPAIAPENVRDSATMPIVKFVGFRGRFYNDFRGGGVGITAEADSAILVDQAIDYGA